MSKSRQTAYRILLAIASCLIVALFSYFAFNNIRIFSDKEHVSDSASVALTHALLPEIQVSAAPVSTGRVIHSSSSTDNSSNVVSELVSNVATAPSADSILHSLLHDLLSAGDAPTRQKYVDTAARQIGNLSAASAASGLLAFLDSGSDFQIGMPFHVIKGGRLKSHPTLRVAVLDWLGEIDAQAAFSYSRTIIARSSLPDEWAIALRNYGRLIDPASDPFFTRTVYAMLNNPQWLIEPTDGFIESFDFIVYDQQYDFLSNLVSIVTQHPTLNIIGSAVLDSLVQHDTRRALNEVLLSKSFDAVPLLRAHLMSRADIRDEQQRITVQSYLDSTKITVDEKAAFLDQFPNASRFVGGRLLTTDHVRSLAEYAAIDRATLNALGSWIDEDAFVSLTSHLRRNQIRLASFVESATRGGYVSE